MQKNERPAIADRAPEDTSNYSGSCSIKGCCWVGSCPIHHAVDLLPNGFSATRALMARARSRRNTITAVIR